MLYQMIGGDREGDDVSPYLLRVYLTPRTRWGGLMLHVFFRGDIDQDMHDHPWDFWTFPLVSYMEECRQFGTKGVMNRFVQSWKWHFRPAKHRHRVLDPLGKMPIVTLMWYGPKSRKWGFWVDSGKTWVPWREYIYPVKYLSEGEMLSDMLVRLSDDERSAVLKISKQRDMIRYHSSWGMWLRNHYKMWDVKNPHTLADAPPNSGGVIADPLFPDQVSARLLERLWAEVHRGGD